jgi:uncharacterized protein (DUF433 family)
MRNTRLEAPVARRISVRRQQNPAGEPSPLPMPTRERTLTVMKLPISTAPDVLGGTPVFAGTRVPIQTLFDYLEGGESIDDFLDGFPSVSRDQVIAFLEMAKDRLIETAL